MAKKDLRLLILYAESDFTPWRENITPDTLVAVMNAASINYKTAITHFTGIDDSMANLLKRFDLIINLCYGYDSYSQADVVKWLDVLSVPHTSSTWSSQMLAMDKAKLPAICHELGIDTPALLSLDEVLCNNETMILKPRYGSLHRGIRIFRNNEITIDEVLNDEILIQPYIYGREFTVAVVPDADSRDYICLPPVEIIPVNNNDKEFIAGNSSGRTTIKYEPHLSEGVKKKMMKSILRLHKQMGLRGMSRTDVRLTDNKLYILDVNCMPNMEPNKSFLPLIARHNGISYHDMVHRLIARFVKHYYAPGQLVAI
jgi:D-alanine-D-alanine ligase